MSDIIERLATSLGKENQLPNIGLARQIISEKNDTAVKVLVDNLYHQNKAIQSDCIKVLYEVGEKSPELISEYLHEFINLLAHKNNRLQWGGMAAIHSITINKAKEVYQVLPKILKTANRGSVITRDHAVGILIKLCTLPTYKLEAFQQLMLQLEECPNNQLPMYAERAMDIVPVEQTTAFIQLLEKRLADVAQESKRKRLVKVIKSFQPKQERVKKKSA